MICAGNGVNSNQYCLDIALVFEAACFWGVKGIEGRNLHKNYTDWEELQYDKNKN